MAFNVKVARLRMWPGLVLLLVGSAAGLKVVLDKEYSLGETTYEWHERYHYEQPFTSMQVTISNTNSAGDTWRVYTGPAGFCKEAQLPTTTLYDNWPFTTIYDGDIDPFTPFDSGIIAGSPSEHPCVVLECYDDDLICRAISVRIRLYASDPGKQQCINGFFPNSPVSVAAPSALSESACANPNDNGVDIFNIPIVTVRPSPDEPEQTLRWCEGTSVCLASQPPVQCPEGLVPTADAPSTLCYNVPQQQCDAWLHDSRDAFVVSPDNAVVSYYFGKCPQTDSGTCYFACDDCAFTCKSTVAARSPSPSPTPSRSPSRSPSPTRTPRAAQSANPSPGSAGANDDSNGNNDDGAPGGNAAPPAKKDPPSHIHAGGIIGIVLGVGVAVVLAAGGGYWYYRKRNGGLAAKDASVREVEVPNPSRKDRVSNAAQA